MECIFHWTFDKLFVHFPDLVQEAATIDKNIFESREEGNLEVEAKIDEEMYVVELFCEFFITFVIIGFEA